MSLCVRIVLGFAAVPFHPLSPQVVKQQNVVIRESPSAGASVEIRSVVNLKGDIRDNNPDGKAGKTTAIWASGSSRYRERYLDVSQDREVTSSARKYLSASLDKQTGDRKERVELRPAVDRVVFCRASNQSTIFSPTGPLMAAELDLLQADAFTAAFSGLLPHKPVKVGDQWLATPIAVSELTGVEPIQSGNLNCVLREVNSDEKGAIARINFSGTLAGPTDQGPTQMTIDGHVLFDLDTDLLTYVMMNGRSEILDSAGRVAGQLEGRYELSRRPAIDDPRLSDSAMKGLALKPTPETTALLFESNELGLRFVYPRNWELTSVNKNTIQLEEPTGGSMRLTLDFAHASASDKLRGDLLAWLKTQKAEITESSPIESIQLSDTRTADRFTVEAALNKSEREWTYFVVRQNDRNAVLAANFVADRAETLRSDLITVARRLEFLRKSQ
jgi:hypothetical protein